MLNDAVLKALEAQMAHEFKNFMTYKSFSGVADFQSYIGATSWFDKQAMEEYNHFNKLFNYICDQGHIPIMPIITPILPQITDLQGLFLQTVALEKETTASLILVSEICKEVKDDQSYELILWYLKEQVEETKTAEDILKRVLMSLNNILIIDNELGAR